MNHTRLRMSPWDVPAPIPELEHPPSLPARLATAFKKLYRRCWLPKPSTSGPSHANVNRRPCSWSVTAALTRDAAFGTVCLEATCHVEATTRTEALASALYQLSRLYPGYSCATLRAHEGPGG